MPSDPGPNINAPLKDQDQEEPHNGIVDTTKWRDFIFAFYSVRMMWRWHFVCILSKKAIYTRLKLIERDLYHLNVESSDTI